MATAEIHAVTGAFGYSGQRIARALLAAGHHVRTLTNSPDRSSPFQPGEIEVHPFHFDRPGALIESLRDVRVLYNTYWIRFNHRHFKQADAVTNSRIMFRAAAEAGVERIVHVSITNPSEDSPLEYFSGKAQLERALRESGVAHSILRPAVLFGYEDILINNIAWLLRRVPVFGVFGDGSYRLQPIHVDDLTRLALNEAQQIGNATIDVIGPETFTYRELVELIAKTIGKKKTDPEYASGSRFCDWCGRRSNGWRRDHHTPGDRGPHE